MKAQLTGKNKNKGFATIEILIAFAVIILCISAVVMVVFSNQSIAVDLETNNEAISKSRALLEEARAKSRFDFDLVNPSTTTETSGSLTYTKKLEVDTSASDPTLDLWTKRVTSTITWESAGRILNTILTTLLTNPGSTDTCGSVLVGDWSNPQKTEYEFGADILADTSSGFPITFIQSLDKKLYVTVNNTNGNNDENFFILDIRDPEATPAVLGKLDNSALPPPNSISEGLNAVAADRINGYSYVTNAYDSSPAACVQDTNCAQFQVIRNNCVDTDSDGIDDICNPSVHKNLKINSITTSGNLANGTSIFLKSGIVYLGLANSTGTEFYTYDVGGFPGGSGSPGDPQFLDSYEIGNGVNSILVEGGYAYVASPNTHELMIFNVEDPSDIELAGYFDSATGAGNGKSLALVGSTLYLGMTVPNAGADFHILNNVDPESALPEIGPGLNSASSINGIIIRDFLAFFITKTEFQIWKIDNPASITPYAAPLTLPPGGGGQDGTASDCEGNYIFVGSEGASDKGYLSVITSGVASVYTLSNSGNISVTQGSSGSTDITRSTVSGTPPSEILTVSGLPAGATSSFSNNPCTPDCSSTLTINTTLPTTPAGTYSITVNTPSGVSTHFDLIVSEAFDYSITNPATTLTLHKGGPSVNLTATITRTAGTSQLVTVTAPNPRPVQITIIPASSSCTPSSTPPYTCSINFSYQASNGPSNSYNNQTFTGSPYNRIGTPFTIDIVN